MSMNIIRQHIKKGKPVIGIRTASHAFQLRKETLPSGHEEWTNWDHEIIEAIIMVILEKGYLQNPSNISRSTSSNFG